MLRVDASGGSGTLPRDSLSPAPPQSSVSPVAVPDVGDGENEVVDIPLLFVHLVSRQKFFPTKMKFENFQSSKKKFWNFANFFQFLKIAKTKIQ